ncbi:MAG: hypothetical protein ACYDIA_05605 [Candidatus Humimicrobiaceae bacterium]
MEEITQNIQPTLEEVRDQLENWRKNKTNHREPIPKELWQQSADLAKKHSINEVSKALRLSYADLKDRLYGPTISKQKIKEKCASFIELKYTQPLSAETTTVDIENKRGCKMKICFKGSTDISSLIKTFCQL